MGKSRKRIDTGTIQGKKEKSKRRKRKSAKLGWLLRSRLAIYFLGRTGEGVLASIRRTGKAFRGSIDRTKLYIDALYTES